MTAISHCTKSQLALRIAVQRYKKSSKVCLSILSISLVHFVHFAFGAKNIDEMGVF